MNWDRIAGQWHQLIGQAQSNWGKLTDDDIKMVDGKREKLVGKLQERYGILKDEVERQVDKWTQSISLPSKDAATPSEDQVSRR
jgi:uncharacterized protein YjbJ (UPF0337 family)